MAQSKERARPSRGSTLSRIGEGNLHAGDRHTAFADGSGTTFDRAGADIACSKNVRQAGLERTRLAFVFFPSRRVRHDRSRFDESFFVALDFDWQPFGASGGAVVEAHTFKLFATFRIEPAVIRARSNQDALRSQHGRATFDLETGAIFLVVVTVIKRQGLRWRRKFRTESIGL